MRRLIKVILVTIIIMVTASWLTSIAYGHTSDSTPLNATTEPGVTVAAAPLADAPSATFYGNAIGTITSGDLFYIDSANVTQDISVTLYITNVDNLIHHFKFLTLKVAVYYEVGEGQWERALLIDGSAFPDIFLTIRNGLVTFNLPGLARYKVALDSGCYNCHPAGANIENITPLFYLEADSI